MVAKSYCGNGKYGLASITKTAQSAMRLPIVEIECINEFADMKSPEMCPESIRLNKY